MKVAFINEADQHIGIQYLAAILKANGHEVKIFDDPRLFDDMYVKVRALNRLFDYQEDLIKEITFFNPGLIGFSVSSPVYQWACSFASKIKKRLNIPIIFGGLHPTAVPERVLKKDCVDMVCIGEGEYPLLELANSMDRGEIDYSIRNLWFKMADGRLIRNDIRPLQADLDALPFPDNEVFYGSSAYHTQSYVTLISRGCPNNCSYCYMSYYHELYRGKGKRIRHRSVKNVIDEIAGITSKYKHVKRIMFPDNCFGTDIAWLREFAGQYSTRVGLDFFCVMHPHYINPESIAYLKTAGCRSISLGIQSWDASLRYNILNRKVSNEAMENAVRLVIDAKIELLIDNMFDYPGYAMEEFIGSLDIYKRYKPTRNYFYKLHYYPQTQLSKLALEKGWITIEQYDSCLEGGSELGILRYETSSNDKSSALSREYKQAQVLFVLMDIVPASWTNFILKRKLYRFFPTFINPAILTMLRTIIAQDFESRYFKGITYWRYGYFIKKKLLKFFK